MPPREAMATRMASGNESKAAKRPGVCMGHRRCISRTRGPHPVAGTGLARARLMTWRKILCPIDFSPGSETASGFALRLAEKTGAAVTLTHVVEPIYWLPDMGVADGDVFG